jgi:oligoendopeptidase F
MTANPSMTWNLETLCPGGPTGEAFRERLAAVRQQIAILGKRVEALPAVSVAPEAWREVVWAMSDAGVELHELHSFAGCHQAASATDPAARLASQAAGEAANSYAQIWTQLKGGLGEADPVSFEKLAAGDTVLEPLLRELRASRHLELNAELQGLVVQLDREAQEGWGDLYHLLVGRLKGTVEGKEGPQVLGIAAIASLRADPDEEVRHQAYDASQKAWKGIEDECALALQNLTGARQTIFDRVGIDEVATSLHNNRVDQATVEAIFAASEAMRPLLVKYLDHKARWLGKERLDWWDLDAPLGAGGAIGWEEAQELIFDAFGSFDPRWRTFAERALGQGWVEAEKRDGKSTGGFCTSLPKSGESRIFMTFGGSVDTTLTLAHELGHAWHNEVLGDVPKPRRRLTSAFAETASTLAEAVVLDAVLGRASPAERVGLLDQQLQASVAFLMNIPSRYAFERKLFELRRQGGFDPQVLSAEMVKAQQHAYQGALGSWDPTFWCSKLHFYIASFGFYNWPYTFGYLFSASVLARARAEGPAFLPALDEILRRTGSDDAITLGKAALGADVRDPAFWKQAAAPIEARVNQFLAVEPPR